MTFDSASAHRIQHPSQHYLTAVETSGAGIRIAIPVAAGPALFL